MNEPAKVVEEQLRRKLNAAFTPAHMELVNESYMHAVPEGSESHFKLVLVSPHFNGMGLVDRQRKVNEVIAEELAGPVHAFAQHTFTPEEWKKTQGAADTQSPECKGGTGK